MKKSLSVLLALAMVFSMFSAVAFAADTAPQTAQEKFDVLKDKGIFSGINGEAALDQNMTRAQAAVVVSLLFGLDISNPPATATFTDVPAAHWAFKYVEAAVKAGIISGVGDNKYADKADVTVQELAILLVKGLGLQPDEDATVEGNVKDWAKGYVATAIKNNLLPASSDYTGAATREQLVNASYAAYQQVPAQGEVAIQSLTATGAKKLTVAFNKAVDKDKATVKVKKGSIEQTISGKTFSDDNKQVVVELGAKLTKGDYTVEVSGLADAALTKSVTVEDEKVAKLDFSGDKAPLAAASDYTAVNVFVKAYNQYSEDITALKAGSITVHASKGTISGTPSSSGKVTVTTATYAQYYIGEKLLVNALFVDTSTGTSATVAKELTVSDVSRVSSVELVAPKDEINTGSNAANFYVVVNAKDQYGNNITDTLKLNDELYLASTNTYVIDVEKNGTSTNAKYYVEYVDGKAQVRVDLAKGPSGELHDGTTEIFATPTKAAGQRAAVNVTVTKAAALDTLTLNSPAIAVAGEKTDIQIQALDQFGNEITKLADVTSALNGTVSPSGIADLKGSFVQDYKAGKVKFVLDAEHVAPITQAVPINITVVLKNGHSSILNLSLQPQKKAVQVVKADINKALAVGATVDLKNENVYVVDQYGRQFTLKDFGGTTYTVKVEEIDAAANKVDLTNAAVTNAPVNVTITARNKGSEGIKLSLLNGATSVAGSEYTFTAKVVDRGDIADYAIGDVEAIYGENSGTSKYGEELKVEGLLDDGTKVTVPVSTTYYEVVTNAVYGIDLVHTGGKLYVNTPVTTAIDAGKDKDYTLLVIGYTKDGGTKQFTKTINISRVKPEADKFKLVDGSDATREADDIISIAYDKLNGKNVRDFADAVLEVKDQYGEVMAGGGVKIVNAYASKYSVANAFAGVTDADQGKNFTITAVASNGKSFVFRVEIK